MSALQDSLTALVAFLTRQVPELPILDVWFVEVLADAKVDERGRPRVRRTEFRAFEAFDARFDELLAAGYSWINLSCYGLHEGRLVVAVETPLDSGRVPSRPSVNYSGPTNAVRDHGWNAGEMLAII